MVYTIVVAVSDKWPEEDKDQILNILKKHVKDNTSPGGLVRLRFFYDPPFVKPLTFMLPLNREYVTGLYEEPDQITEYPADKMLVFIKGPSRRERLSVAKAEAKGISVRWTNYRART